MARKTTVPLAEVCSVIVIGAGFSGINMAIRLKQQGITDFLVLERAGDIGGTWRDNVYPGCACDVPSTLYSYSFELKPDWSNSFAGYREIHDYIRQCADKYGVREHVRLGRSVTRAVYDASAGEWTLEDDRGGRYRARAVVSAMGGLVEPSLPAIEGLDRFQGRVLHTARWDRAADLRGKRVAVIGTGASAIQVVPAIQPEVGRLTVFQRTAPWVVPKPGFAIPPAVQAVFKRLPFSQRLVRDGVFLATEALVGPAVMFNTPLTALMERVGRWNIGQGIADPALRQKVTPTFRFGCKRMLVSSDYYPALSQPNVRLCTDAIQRVEADGVVTADGALHEADILILATGYQADLARARFPIHGPGGETLEEAWSRPGCKAYKGVTVAGSPNWFIMMGPNTGPGHTSVLVYTEAQVEYALQGIRLLLNGPAKSLSVRPEVQATYGKSLQARLKYSNWSSGCSSWYLDKNGENHTLYPGFVSEYVLRIRRFNTADYVMEAWK